MTPLKIAASGEYSDFVILATILANRRAVRGAWRSMGWGGVALLFSAGGGH
ncbi:hypothetical protein J2X14_003114 [Pantoea alhagi]|nr:hypothetical protein [Pantoea alhagi]